MINRARNESSIRTAIGSGRGEIDKLNRIMINSFDSKSFDFKQLVGDGLPPETKDLREAVNDIKNLKTNKIDLKNLKKKHFKNFNKIKYGILPYNEEDPHHREISKSRFEVFKVDDDKIT